MESSRTATVTLTASAADAGPEPGEDPLRSLRNWIADEGELPVRLAETPPPDGAMGAVTDNLSVILAPGGAAAVLAGSLVAWLRRRDSDVTIKLRRADGAEAEFSATRLRGLDSADLSAVVGSLRTWLGPETAPEMSELDRRGDGDDRADGEGN